MRATLVLTALAALLVLPASACWACSCVAAEPEQYWEWADVVFDGSVTDRSEPDAGREITWTFDVVDVWKGDADATQTIRSHQDGATCGLTFELGVTYRVYANGTGAEMSANLCSGTAPRDSFPAGAPAKPAGGDPTGPGTPTAQPPGPGEEPTALGPPGDGPVTPVGTDEGTDLPVAPVPEPGPVTPADDPTTAVESGTVSTGGSNSGVAIAAGAGGIGLLVLAIWIVRRQSTGG